ncbi:3-isopropylmalate dehydratase small subunit [Enterobacteriaceae endosymbiont of Donacia bicoloricornis]|uniref:3-isopropylmalate dehydratase small subunit n=1 Tax=Enterobacteriaceae endosymbiont of Donacia bicoloricornis TaxID=2675772 RepID=UPI001449C70C|nr:3-isopropylmalate dehydratase small subunit [Enterobacteriaceae endosymbiont of Donacia bicoloricornis]QJC37593.1 3-isopropylmalate dehydratase small subunit [Enterobacteriaceae endosymbiont of Donacia bicoloricornis]
MNNKLQFNGIIVPFNRSNIDTDVIIPKQFLQKNNKQGFGKYLFNDWRYLDNESKIINPNFILNKKEFKNSKILLTRDNFGCGSSREHAPWALLDFGFHTIIASSYADIFYNNAINNKLLLIILNKKIIDQLFFIIQKSPGIYCYINLFYKKIIINKKIFNFKINNDIVNFITNDLDQIDLTKKYSKEINIFEKTYFKFF